MMKLLAIFILFITLVVPINAGAGQYLLVKETWNDFHERIKTVFIFQDKNELLEYLNSDALRYPIRENNRPIVYKAEKINLIIKKKTENVTYDVWDIDISANTP